ncbi:MAG: hypothetical protein MN733_26905 [Nitrososphaera sp.]|nr:hypothetical protein [Nitrososphaera sp.]
MDKDVAKTAFISKLIFTYAFMAARQRTAFTAPSISTNPALMNDIFL